MASAGRASAGDVVVLVTGAAGFVGAAVARRLRDAGCHVLGLDISPAPSDAGFVNVEADLRDAQAVQAVIAEHRPGRIVHAGAISGPMIFPDDPRLVFEINVLGTLNVLESARRLGVDRVVFLSSFVAYGEQRDDAMVAEDQALAATDAYGCSKIAGEAMARAYRERHGVRTISLRLGAVYGPGRTTRCFVRAMLEEALAGRETVLEHGAGWHRSYVHIDDVAMAIQAALDAPAGRLTQPAYNVGGGIWPTLDEVAGAAGDAVPGLRVSLEPGRIPFDYRIGPLDLGAVGRDLGYRPRILLRDGIARYHAWLAERADRSTR